MTDAFSEKLQAWRDYTETPWGRIRYAVVEETLRRETSRLGPGLRILDVGGGDGRDSVPLAKSGHEVTILDQSSAWLEEAGRRAAEAGVPVGTVLGDMADPPVLGEYDMVLCHFVLQYRPADADDLERLAGYVRPGGLLSVMVPNPVGMVLRRLVQDGPAGALEELQTDVRTAVTFNTRARKIPMAELEAALEKVGLSVIRRYGTRVVNDLLTDDDLKHDHAYFEDLLRLEMALCDQEPYLRAGALYQLVAERI